MDEDRDPKTGRFLPGNSGFGGRPKGARSKLGEQFLTALQADFEEHGVAALQSVREERPHEYLKVVASLLPKDVNLNMDASQAFVRLWTAISEDKGDELADRLIESEEPAALICNGRSQRNPGDMAG